MSSNQNQRSKSLTYPTQKVVLKYLDVNLRIKISVLSPDFFSVDHLVPLRIDSLRLDNNITRINETTYTVGIYRKYPNGTVPPRLHEEENENGGVDFDLDRWGFRDLSMNEVLYPGDVILHGAVDIIEDQDETRMFHLELQRNSEQAFMDVGIRENNIHLESIKTMLLPFQCRESNKFPEFEPCLQLTISSPASTTIWRFQIPLKLFQAIRNLRSKLFSSRGIIEVNMLVIDMRRKLLRLPEFFKIKTKEIRIMGAFSLTLNDLSSVIHRSSYPLKVLEADIMDRVDLEHPDLVSTNTLIIFNETSNHFHTEQLGSIKNRVVYFVNDIFSINEIVEMIRIWIQTGRNIGSRLSFKIKELGKVMQLTHHLQLAFETKVVNNIITISINDSSNLEVVLRQTIDGIPQNIVFVDVVPA